MSNPYGGTGLQELLTLCKGDVAAARDALAFIRTGQDDAARILRAQVIYIIPIPADGPQQWNAALQFLSGADA